MSVEPIDVEPPDAELAGSPPEADLGLLGRTWEYAAGLRGWFAEVDHTRIGTRYIVTALIFFALGGLEALAMRVQLARPENRFLGPDLYNQVFTTHGSTMMFLFAVPIMLGLGVYLVPLMVGTRNLAFPRLNAFSYYVYLIGGLFLYVAFFLNTGPDAGWFAYVPLSGPQFSPGKRVDVWAQMITFTEISSLAVAINLITTIFKQRAPGMSLNRIPLYVWAMLVTSFMVVFAMPAVMLSSLMLALDRLVDTHFFNPAQGGDALLWQHLFWFFGHPEVYIIFLPATGIVSSILAPFTRREVFGYMALVLSLVATGFIGFGLWVHHMFATGLPQLGASFFTAASILIAIPAGTQIFCWIATLWGGHLRFKTPLLYVLGFLFTFVIGGLTGVMLAAVPLDLQVHDTFFVVAHFHYVLIGGAVFPLLGGLFYWFPKMTGRLLSEAWGKVSFWLVFLGFQVTFFPQHILGLEGMPRRVYTYLPGTGWGSLNLLSTVGAFVLGLGVLVFLLNGIVSLRTGEPAGNDPWGSDTLEWSVSSPPPPYNFQYLPTVGGRSPRWLWHEAHPVVTGLRSDRREFLITALLDAEPDHRQVSPGPTLIPLYLALGVGVTFIVGIFTPWGLPIGMVPSAIALIAWFWPRGDQGHPPPQAEEGDERMKRRQDLDVSDLPTTAFGQRDPLWWGVVGIMSIEGTMFAIMAASYFYLRGTAYLWPPPGVLHPGLSITTLNLGILLLSVFPMHRAARAAEREDLPKIRLWLAVWTVLFVAFLAVRIAILGRLTFRWDSHAYGSLVWTTVGLHTLHVLTGIVENLLFIAVLTRGPVEDKLMDDLRLNSMYGYFVVACWVLFYCVFFLDPGLLHATAGAR